MKDETLHVLRNIQDKNRGRSLAVYRLPPGNTLFNESRVASCPDFQTALDNIIMDTSKLFLNSYLHLHLAVFKEYIFNN